MWLEENKAKLKEKSLSRDENIYWERVDTQTHSIEWFIRKKNVSLPWTLRNPSSEWKIYNNPKILWPLKEKYWEDREIMLLISPDRWSIQVRLTWKDYYAEITLIKKDIVLVDEVVAQFKSYYNALVEKIERENNPTRVAISHLKEEIENSTLSA